MKARPAAICAMNYLNCFPNFPHFHFNYGMIGDNIRVFINRIKQIRPFRQILCITEC